jgi:hypothetical protein
MITLNVVVILSLLSLSGLFQPANAGLSVDHGIYAALLKAHVKDGRVDYRGFKTDEEKLGSYLTILEKTDTGRLSPDEQFAFYINAYNAWTIRLILSGYPGIESIKDLGNLFQSPWKKKICRIDGKILTLDEIEHEILRPRFKDPRVHFAINCAARSCPPLYPEPFSGKGLNQQLDAAAAAFINDPERNRLEGNALYVSKIFKWFSEDFNDDIIGFFQRYAQGDLKTGLNNLTPPVEIKYLDYDWSLNGA